MSSPASPQPQSPSQQPARPTFLPAEDTAVQDWDKLERWCTTQGQVLGRDTPPRQFAGGLGNLNYLVRIDGSDRVLRRPPPGNLPPGANDMRREFQVLKNLWREFPLAPKAFSFCDDAAVLGAPFLVMEYRPGLVIGADLPRPLTLPQRTSLGHSLVDLLVGLHAVDPAAVGLDSLGRPDGMLTRMVEGWRQRADGAWDGAVPKAIDELTRWLRAELPTIPQQTARLLHSDFKLDNVILDPDSLAPRAVIDWDMGTRGDPLVDLATLLSYWTQPDDPPEMLALRQMPTAADGFPTRRQVIERYARATGIDVSRLHFYRVLTMFKLVVVFQQLHMRFRRNEASNPRYAGFGVLAAGLLDFTSQGRNQPDF